MTWLGLDIGGANLKAADGRGFALARTFSLWKSPEKLQSELTLLLSAAPPCTHVAVAMTGELADCFATKADGVAAILEAVVGAGQRRALHVYATDGRFVDPIEATRTPLKTAASNWHALSAFAVRYGRSEPALLIDVGSTTVDVIPLNGAGPTAVGRTDPERLTAGELVYTGIERTPVCAIVSHLPWQGRMCPVAAEFFATTADAYVLLGDVPEDVQNGDTADGRARTRSAARARLSRMVCTDATMFSDGDAIAAAAAIRDAQAAQVAAAAKKVVNRMPAPPKTVILSGHGEFLARMALDRAPWSDLAPEVLLLSKLLGALISRCATAHALAVLAEERLGNSRA
jgi:probable H4MPT-linked C1 transfer pathway protein